MQFSVNKKELRDILSKIQGITGRRSNLSITENVLFKVSSDGIYVSATDLETGFQGSYPAEVESEGDFAINAKKLFEIVKDATSSLKSLSALVPEISNSIPKFLNNAIGTITSGIFSIIISIFMSIEWDKIRFNFFKLSRRISKVCR